MVQQHTALAVASMVVLVVAAPATLGVPVPLAQEDADATNQASCDYQQLYDRTVDSVVAVTRGQGGGSGFVVETDEANSTSYVVTNAHVVGDASSVTVEFERDESRRGVVVGTDRITDLAVVRVDDAPSYAQSLPVAESPPEPGQKVAALGHPFGLEETITSGIVSGTDRSLPTTEEFTLPKVLQTDAAISPGNSGGPLVTCDGTVVGVNTAGIAQSQAENIGFAVSAAVVSEVVPELREEGEARHAFLGVGVARITPPVAQANDLNTTSGAYVTTVGEGMPAADALRGATDTATVSDTRVPVGGDVVVAADGQAIESPQDLKEFLLLQAQPGDTVTLTVLRDGERTDVTVTVVERPEPGTD